MAALGWNKSAARQIMSRFLVLNIEKAYHIDKTGMTFVALSHRIVQREANVAGARADWFHKFTGGS
jgi:hypothetical protein